MTQLSSKQLPEGGPARGSSLEARANPFGGMVITPSELPSDATEFAQRLEVSLKEWIAEGKRAAWLEVPIGKSALIPEAVNQGFIFHHSSEDYLMLTIILQDGAWLPHFATHYIGIGGVVLTPERELLVVREIYGVAGRPPTLKLPGGALHPDENLAEAVEREGAGGDRCSGRVRGHSLFPALARIPLRQVGHLLCQPAATAEPRDHHAGRRDPGVSLVASGRFPVPR